MKKQQHLMTAFAAFATFAIALSTSSSAVRADSTGAQARVEIPVEALLAPGVGFEEKNNIQVVLYGGLPNTCYTLADTTSEKVDNHTVRIRQFANRDLTGMCASESTMPEHLKMAVPFVQEVSVGQLPAGDYRFEFNKRGGGTRYRAMNVARNVTPTIDSLPYAAVSAVQADDVLNGLDRLVVTISGVLNSTCTSLDSDVKIMKEDDVLVLLPTIKVQPGVLCAQILLPFEKRLDLGNLPPGIHLIHTRSMNGRAVNKVVSVMK